MRRLMPVSLLLLVGCGVTTETTIPPPSQAPAPPAEPDFTSWPSVTDRPVPVNAQFAAMCRAAIPDDGREAKRHGPHFKPAIVVRVNPEAVAAFKAGRPLPVGTTVVKEKHHDREAKGPPTEYGAMIKRAAGYDPPHGDWEYLYVVTTPDQKVTRGKLGSCIDCHANRADNDYLFRDYLPPAPLPPNGIR